MPNSDGKKERRDAEQRIRLTNEFSHIELELDGNANGPRLRITDVATAEAEFFDSLLIEALLRAPAQLLDPYIVRDSKKENPPPRST